MRFSDLRGRRVVVWGHGREGRSVARRCRELGIDVVVAEPEDQPDQFDQARAALLGAEVCVKSPGVPVTSPLYAEVVRRGVSMTSLSDLFVSEHAGRVVAVTGSKGKSTTASLVHHLLLAGGHRSSLRGNIGTDVLDEPDPPADVVVMELSSYQAQSLTRSPRLVVVTSLFPEHLPWHGSEEAYYRDKLNAVAHGPEAVVVPADDPRLEELVRARLSPGAELVRAETAPATAGVAVGGHQQRNLGLALRVAERLGVDRAVAGTALATFAPLPHRMERVASDDGRTWIDDSLATAPQAVVASLESLPDEPVCLLLGGAERGLDFAPLLEHASGRQGLTVLLVGPVGRRLAPATGWRCFARFGDAVAWARSAANPARTVLLSPGAPSFDEFASYEHRSAAFRAGARGALGSGAAGARNDAGGSDG